MRLVLVIPPCGGIAQEQRVPLAGTPIEVGGASDCDAIVDHPSVGTARVRFERQGDDWVALDREGRGKCLLGGVPLHARAPRIVRPPRSLVLGEVAIAIEVDLEQHEESAIDEATREVALRAAAAAIEIHPGRPRVRVVEGARIGQTLDLVHQRVYRFGRGESCDLFLDEDGASREHFTLELAGARVVVRDQGSARGTFLGQTRLEPQRGAVWDPARLLQAADTVFSLDLPNTKDEPWLAPLERAAGQPAIASKLDASSPEEGQLPRAGETPSILSDQETPMGPSEAAATLAEPRTAAPSPTRARRVEPLFLLVVAVTLVALLAVVALVFVLRS